MAKATPLECAPAVCGDLLAKCGNANTYSKGCRCMACCTAKRESNRRYAERNPDKIRASNRNHYEANREARIEYGRQYRQENAEEVRARERAKNSTPEQKQKRKEYVAANLDQINETRRVWNQANPEKIRQKNRNSYARNSDARREAARRYRAENPDVIRAWYQANADKTRFYSANRRALNTVAYVEHVDPIIVFDRDNWICQMCGIQCSHTAKRGDRDMPSLDHIIPLSAGIFRGGFHSYANTQTLCLSCNSSKGARIE